MGHHKHKVSALPEALNLDNLQESAQLPLISPNRLGRELGIRKNSCNGGASSSVTRCCNDRIGLMGRAGIRSICGALRCCHVDESDIPRLCNSEIVLTI